MCRSAGFMWTWNEQWPVVLGPLLWVRDGSCALHLFRFHGGVVHGVWIMIDIADTASTLQSADIPVNRDGRRHMELTRRKNSYEWRGDEVATVPFRGYICHCF